MKIKFDQLFEKPLLNFPILLLFGNDAGVLERGKSFVLGKHRGQNHLVETLDEASFLKGDLGGEAPDLFAAPTAGKLIVVDDIGEKTMKILGELLSSKNEGTSYLFTSSKVRASAPSLKSLEIKPSFLAVACYGTPLVWAEFLDALPTLPEVYQKSLFRALQHHPSKLKDVAHKVALLGDHMEASDLQDLLPSLMGGAEDRALVEGFITRNPRLFVQGEIIEPIPFIRSLGRALHQLLQLMTHLRSGTPQREALQKAGVFFKDEPLFLAGLKKWNFKDLMGHLELMGALECDVKFKGLSGLQVHHQCLLAMGG